MLDTDVSRLFERSNVCSRHNSDSRVSIDASCFVDTSINIHESPQISTNIYKYLQISINIHECPQISTNIHKCPRISTNAHKYPQRWHLVRWEVHVCEVDKLEHLARHRCQAIVRHINLVRRERLMARAKKLEDLPCATVDDLDGWARKRVLTNKHKLFIAQHVIITDI